MVCRHGIECTELECMYSCSHWSTLSPPDLVIEKFYTAVQKCYNENKLSIKSNLDLPYGDGERQKIDIWGDEENWQTAFIFFHGGYWQHRWPKKRLFAGGHSAGAHLALSALLSLGSESRYDGAFLISGVYFLQDLPATYIGRAIKLKPSEAKTASIEDVHGYKNSIMLLVGSLESPQLLKQSQKLFNLFKMKAVCEDIQMKDIFENQLAIAEILPKSSVF
ncbi:unnamed protein product [Anisakis simplex]|uniref:Kynurenine formamidase (inferred by orthology to a D. melanogaster protein) n=1 Tax=Anisakis simplex TaxID=6269 RepID=A0A0M3K8L7_ANISI|nr:unnamed protein product [Anisakis simplex]